VLDESTLGRSALPGAFLVLACRASRARGSPQDEGTGPSAGQAASNRRSRSPQHTRGREPRRRKRGSAPPLLCGKSRGAPGRLAGRALHIVRRHGGRVEGGVILEVEVPRGWLCRNRKRLWYATEDVPPGAHPAGYRLCRSGRLTRGGRDGTGVRPCGRLTGTQRDRGEVKRRTHGQGSRSEGRERATASAPATGKGDRP
jgi:hypothetical protein